MSELYIFILGQETKKPSESKKKMAPSQSRDREVQPWNFDRHFMQFLKMK